MPARTAVKTQLKRNTDLLIAGLVVGIVLLIIIPMPPHVLDVLLSLSITIGLTVLLITMFTTEPLQFSIFPSLLLVTTLYRLALNISSTRLILGQAYAGNVIDAFGHFVAGGNYVVGFIVFIIITVIQFVVITSGAGRVAEVGARFTLDAMPGKQMSIDADFNSGLITETEAREKRRRLQREADFFGAMDGASKFVRGDAIAGIIITLVNIIGGLAIGVLQMSMPVTEALRTYTVLTIGDGLVTQVPSVLISTAAGILVTRATSDASFGADISRQFTAFPKILFVVAGVLFVLGCIPAMPNILFLSLSVAAFFAARSLAREKQREETSRREAQARQQMQQSRREPENVATYFQVDPLQIEFGYNLIPLTDENQGGDLLHRLAAVRRQCALEMGIYVRPIRIRDNLQLTPNTYVFKIRGEEGARAELMPGHFLAMDPAGREKDIPGIPTTEPTFGLPAWWVTAAEKEKLELAGLTVVDPSTVLVTHLTEFIKAHAHELLGRQEVKELLEAVKEKDPAVVEELSPDLLGLGEVQKVLQNLLRERVPLRDMVTILEALADGARLNRDADFLTDHVRGAMARTLSRLYLTPEGKLAVFTLHPRLEKTLEDATQKTQLGAYPVLEPGLARQVLEKVRAAAENMSIKGLTPVVLCSPRVRLPFRRLIERYLPNLAVLSLNEIAPDIEVEALGTVTVE
ncbi:flagellar biosynthesis protein FlhA [Desulfotomaculum copahuensis]|uniref:Flagellar biosynthesis protein FlhA n=1 Tax=Desulfotomaculum copahuensis TaxID=1838280 RepID=A0A1B7LBR5_9FIRM|nr:flagellar biosynthesis protein FlhA [Desulfotomaculum copahuensis]OAT79923.1 flagellar biosynthesis protein FlhA [Desulfotomaculum copahuensis]